MEVFGGGSSTEALVGLAMGAIEAGMCRCVVIFRAMNGYSQVRIGGTGARSAVPVAGEMLHNRAYGWQSAGQMFSLTFMRHMHDYGTTPAQVAAVRATHSAHASYDAFTFTTMLQLEDYGFCKKGEGGQYVSDGTIRLGGRRPNNTSGGHLCEGYTHGMNMVIENVRQLRHDADDSCPIGPDGKHRHTYDYEAGGCRQVQRCEVTANLGWATPGTGSALGLRGG